MKKSILPLLLVMWTAGSVGLGTAVGQTTDQPNSPKDVSEASLVENIKRLSKPELVGLSDAQPLPLQLAVKQQTLAYIDALLERYPKTSFREEALVIKLRTLADLARVHPAHLQQLLSLTDEIARGGAKDRLASENAFYAIQAFVLGARHEGMPERRRLIGTRERYEAFLEDYPKSEHIPVIRASLIRNLIALNKIDLARAEFDKLKRDHPDHKATRRAQGELHRVVAVGRPFAFTYTTPGGETIRPTKFLGKVLIVHFWATWSERSMKQLPDLIALHREFKDRGLELIGVNVDKDRRRIDEALRTYEMPWPQHFDRKGFENDMLVATGVVKTPTYFVVDRKGVLRSIDPGDGMRDLVKKLLAEK